MILPQKIEKVQWLKFHNPLKPWPNGVASRRKLKLATPFGQALESVGD